MEATAPDGYSGAIQLLVAADFKGTVLGTRVTEHHETPGWAIKSNSSVRLDHPFAGKVIHGQGDSHWAVKKTAAISTSSPAPPLPRARWSMPLSAPACMHKRCPRRFPHSLLWRVTMSEVKDVIVQGLWKNNSALVQLLGMCPLLAVTSTATNALGLGWRRRWC
jgi:hypothetical protein